MRYWKTAIALGIVAILLLTTQTRLLVYMGCIADNLQKGEEALPPYPNLSFQQEAVRNVEMNAKDMLAMRRWLSAWLENGFDHYGKINTSLFVRDIDAVSGTPVDFIWNPENNGADNYPYLVLAALMLQDDAALNTLRGTLRDERKYAKAYGGLGVNYNLMTDAQFAMTPMPGYLYTDRELSVRHTAEYVRDGLLTIIEAMPEKEWIVEGHSMLQAMIHNSNFLTSYGMLPFDDTEANGNALQSYVRFYYMTNDSSLIPAIQAIADAYVYEVMNQSSAFPPLVWDFTSHSPKSNTVKLREHGQEIVEGIILAYMLERDLGDRERANFYNAAIEKLLRSIALRGTNQDGMLYAKVDIGTGLPLGKGFLADHTIFWPFNWVWKLMYPQKTLYCLGEPLDNYDTGRRIILPELTKTFGYVYNGFLMFAELTGQNEFASLPVRALENLPEYRWEMPEMIGDSTESGFYLYKNLQANVDRRQFLAWIEHNVGAVLASQRENGFFGGKYADEGNVVRALILHSHFLTQGIRVKDWNEGIQFGASYDVAGGVLYLAIINNSTDSAVVTFDTERHKKLGLREDYPRTQMLMEWYTVEPYSEYTITDTANGKTERHMGKELIAGVPVAGKMRSLAIKKVS